jgi:hypothetical protein
METEEHLDEFLLLPNSFEMPYFAYMATGHVGNEDYIHVGIRSTFLTNTSEFSVVTLALINNGCIHITCTAGTGECPDGYERHGPSCYHAFGELRSWDDAQVSYTQSHSLPHNTKYKINVNT